MPRGCSASRFSRGAPPARRPTTRCLAPRDPARSEPGRRAIPSMPGGAGSGTPPGTVRPSAGPSRAELMQVPDAVPSPGAAEPVRQPAHLRGVRPAVPDPAVEPGIRRAGDRVVVRAQIPQAPHEQPRTVRHVRDDGRPQEPAPSHLRPGHPSPERAQRRRPESTTGGPPFHPGRIIDLSYAGRGQAGDCGPRLGAGGGPGHRPRSGRPLTDLLPAPRRSRCGTSFSWAPTPTNITRRGRTPWRSGCGPGWRRCGGSRTGNESSIASASDRCRGPEETDRVLEGLIAARGAKCAGGHRGSERGGGRGRQCVKREWMQG